MTLNNPHSRLRSSVSLYERRKINTLAMKVWYAGLKKRTHHNQQKARPTRQKFSFVALWVKNYYFLRHNCSSYNYCGDFGTRAKKRWAICVIRVTSWVLNAFIWKPLLVSKYFSDSVLQWFRIQVAVEQSVLKIATEPFCLPVSWNYYLSTFWIQ